MGPKTERYYPIVSGLILATIFLLCKSYFKDIPKLIEGLLGSSLVVSATLLGFLLTITTIINTINTRRMRFLRDQGGIPLLQSYLNTAIWLNIVCVSMSIIFAFLYDIDFPGYIQTGLYFIQVFIIFYAWIASIRFAVLFISLLKDTD